MPDPRTDILEERDLALLDHYDRLRSEDVLAGHAVAATAIAFATRRDEVHGALDRRAQREAC